MNTEGFFQWNQGVSQLDLSGYEKDYVNYDSTLENVNGRGF